MRSFVSVDLPDTLAAPIAAIQDTLDAPGLNLVNPGQAHITLKFLGDLDPADVDTVQAGLAGAVRGAGVDPFDARLEGLGVFPNRDYIRVIWLGVAAGADRLARLHDAVESAALEMGFEPESHSFTPHVTLARMQHAGGKDHVTRVLDEADPRPGEFRVEAVRLKRSDRGPDGPAYSTLAEFPLS